MKVAIVGSGGAGMTAAWLLDGRHDVTVFERNAILGGHAHTTSVERGGRIVHADDGFGWFSDALYPTFMRLLETLGAPTRIVPMSLSFVDEPRGRCLPMPPLGLGQILAALGRPGDLLRMLGLDRAMRLAGPMVWAGDTGLDWDAFLRHHRFDPTFVEEILTPVVIGCWGAPFNRAGEMSAYTVMKYLVFHRPSKVRRYRWHVLRDGASSYIHVIARGLTTGVTRPGVGVTAIEPAAAGWTVRDTTGAAHAFDRVLVTAGAPAARAMLVDHPLLAQARAALDGFEYYHVRLATHSDPDWMPRERSHWRVANVRTDGRQPALTIWSGAEWDAPVFTSYVYDREPRECHNISRFHLPLMTLAHHRAQAALAAVQGERGLWFAGDYTRDIGCHEDAVVSALEACRALDPGLPRLAQLSGPRAHPPMRALPEGPSWGGHLLGEGVRA